jgi:6-phosphogluconolactonase (cycloisomerase 2 family)
MKLSLFGRFALAMFASLILGLGMTGCGGGTVAFLWVLGQQYNQIAGFKVDDFTGNLTQIPHQPFTSGGTAPVMLVVKPGGRYVYVLNQGTGGAQGTLSTGGNIALFSVGGDGVLTFQQSYQSQGFNSQYIQMDQTGSYLYVLDQYAPKNPVTGVVDGNGAVTAFASDPSTGRLTLINNQQSCVNGVCPTYFEVGSVQTAGAFPAPFMMKSASSCLYIANRTGVVPFAVGAGGQLVTSTTSSIITATNAAHISSITGNSSYVNLTDDVNDTLYRYAVGSACALSIVNAGALPLAQYNIYNPTFTLIDNSGKYVYVIGQSNTNTAPQQRFSSIAGFTVLSTGNTNSLQFNATYGVGSGPVCTIEDPTNQYIYTSNHNDGTISGNVIDTTTGDLSPLTRGATFSATGQAECLAASGSID